MTNLYHSDQGHWYTRNGLPMYEVPTTSPQAKNPMRAVTVKDADELDLYPSVTTIMRVLHKPGLQQWLYQQYILSALTLPKVEGESLDAFATRVATDARVESSRAADFGSRLHALIEWWIGNLEQPDLLPPIDLQPMDLVYLENAKNWIDLHVSDTEALEKSFTNRVEGFGGKFDHLGVVDGLRCLVDWKTQNTLDSQGKPRAVNFYPEWGPQLRAYAVGVGEPDIPCLSVVISSTEPDRMPETFLWMDEDWQWETFKAMRTIWYSPLGQGERLRSRFQESNKGVA